MTKNLPTAHPAEVIEISPEALEVANCYLQNQSIEEVSNALGVSTDLVAQILARREVKSYINQVFFEVGFNNRFRLREVMDILIKKKLQEMDEADIGSSKDILEILALSHKMTMDALDKEIQLEKIRGGNAPRSQVNVQINDGGGTNYGNLIERLVNVQPRD